MHKIIEIVNKLRGNTVEQHKTNDDKLLLPDDGVDFGLVRLW